MIADADNGPANLDQPRDMFRHRQQLRQWAARVLLLWLFGIVAGIANACSGTGLVAPVATATSYLVVPEVAHQDAVAHDHAKANGAGLPSQNDNAPAYIGNSPKASCQDCCDMAASSIPPLKSARNDIQPQAVVAMAVVTVMQVPTIAPMQLWVPRRDGVLAPPVPMPFLRLAL